MSDLILREPTLPARSSPLSGIDVGALLQQATASEAVDAIERIVALRREMHAEQAKASFDEAMSAFQSECPPITKTKNVDNKYSYAPLEVIEHVIRPICRKHGFSHTFDTDTSSVEGYVIAKCVVTHRDGHSRISSARFPLTTKTNIMSATQQYAATLTFANRRALMNAYGIVVCGEDLDGQTERQKPRGPSKIEPPKETLKPLAVELWAAVKATGATTGREKDWSAVNQFLWDREILDGAVPEEAPNLTAERFRQVIDAVKGVAR